jgi:hypothetical protein
MYVVANAKPKMCSSAAATAGTTTSACCPDLWHTGFADER